MSVRLPQILEQSAEHVFYKIPDQIEINKELKTQYSTNAKIEVLIQELKEKGPMIGLGQHGPQAYDGLAKMVAKSIAIGETEMYGWPPGSRKESTKSLHILILGAKKTNSDSYVYFTLSTDCTINQASYIRIHKPSKQDAKIYVISHKSFHTYLTDLYLQNISNNNFKTNGLNNKSQASSVYFTSSISNNSQLSSSQQIYMQQLCELPLNSILDRGEGEKKCKALGQEIFDKYKQEANGSSEAGRVAAKNICDAIKSHPENGALRKQYVEYAWEGIGDSDWKWAH